MSKRKFNFKSIDQKSNEKSESESESDIDYVEPVQVSSSNISLTDIKSGRPKKCRLIEDIKEINQTQIEISAARKQNVCNQSKIDKFPINFGASTSSFCNENIVMDVDNSSCNNITVQKQLSIVTEGLDNFSNINDIKASSINDNPGKQKSLTINEEQNINSEINNITESETEGEINYVKSISVRSLILPLTAVKKRGRPKKILTTKEIDENKQKRRENDAARKRNSRNNAKQNSLNNRNDKIIDSDINKISESKTEGEIDYVKSIQVSSLNSPLIAVKKRGRPKRILSTKTIEEIEKTQIEYDAAKKRNVHTQSKFDKFPVNFGASTSSFCNENIVNIDVDISFSNNIMVQKQLNVVEGLDTMSKNNEINAHSLSDIVDKQTPLRIGNEKKIDSEINELSYSETKSEVDCDGNVQSSSISPLTVVKKRGRPKKILSMDDINKNKITRRENDAARKRNSYNQSKQKLTSKCNKKGRPKIRSIDVIKNQNNLRQVNYREQHSRKQLNNTKVISINSHLNIEKSNIISEHYIGKMSLECDHCKAKHFVAEKLVNKGNSFNDCCNHGKVQLKSIPMVNKLRLLFENNDSMSNILFERIRAYNNSFAFASLNANLVKFGTNRQGPYCFKIQGQVYYHINTALFPENNESPCFGQLYILDPSEASSHRLEYNDQLNSNLLLMLDKIIRDHNIFAQSYQMMYEEIENEKRKAAANNTVIPKIEMTLTTKPNLDNRQFNLQRVNEVAAIFTTDADGNIPDTYITVKNKSTKELKLLSNMDPNVEPLLYPLFYPYGNKGYDCNYKKVNCVSRISRLEYVKYQIAIRDEFNQFLRGRKLFQQWIVDKYVQAEKDRITFCKLNQNKLRIDSYSGLMDHLNNLTDNENIDCVGKVIVLPSSFIGSPRNMIQSYQDAMAIVRVYGKPDLFITMTCNPKWREIEENLLPGQIASDRPDLCTRVFDIKKDCLLDLIEKKEIFGDVLAHVHVIEFQKRGLPHAHMLVTLKQNSKITTPEIVDRYISAEIPDPVENPNLHKFVMKHMIHGPCGNWCIKDGVCSKRYPRCYQNETIINADGYPTYRRRDNKKIYERPGCYTVDNRHVVPYCPLLLSYFDCHINVEVVSSIKSVKYLYKYVYKGNDMAAVTISQIVDGKTVIVHDEIKQYIETRYVSPIEACWRIFCKRLQKKSHTISRLAVHLPNQHNVVINMDSNDDNLINRLNTDTHLTAYFNLNSRDENAKKYLYAEIPLHYVLEKIKVDGRQIKQWKKRKSQFKVIGRMYSVSPTNTELYNLRLLLLVVKGATSFEDLKTINGVTHQTFTDACLALGLIEDDEEWYRAMNEAEIYMMPRQLRKLFTRILIHCRPIYPDKLWNEFKIAMSEDFLRHFGLEDGQKMAYSEINKNLNLEGHSVSDFNIMEVIDDKFSKIESCKNTDINIGEQQYNKLNNQQKIIVDTIMNSVRKKNNSQNCFYLDGPGGTGKTFIYSTLYHMLIKINVSVQTMAFTGIAATLLPHGKTVHKTFLLPVPLYSDSSSNIKLQSIDAKKLKNTDVFIWDEAPMAPRYAIEIINKTLQDIMGNKKLFGGKIVILGGDFRQLLPVQINSTRNELVNLSIKKSLIWKNFKIMTLTKNMRALPEEVEFSKFLLDLGDGKLNLPNDEIELPKNCVADFTVDIVHDMFGKLLSEKKYDSIADYAILSVRNVDVDEINNRVVELLDSTNERIYTSVDSADLSADNGKISEALLPEYLNTLSPTSLPPYKLHLKKYCVVMLIRNLSIHEGLCNGTRLLVLDCGINLLKCQILTGDKKGDIVFLNRITLYCEDVYPFTFKRRQFPVKLAFAMTINKAQGQTFEKIGIDLRKDVFNHGQLYVACSRVRSWNALKIYLGEQRNSYKVKNYVYEEIFS